MLRLKKDTEEQDKRIAQHVKDVEYADKNQAEYDAKLTVFKYPNGKLEICLAVVEQGGRVFDVLYSDYMGRRFHPESETIPIVFNRVKAESLTEELEQLRAASFTDAIDRVIADAKATLARADEYISTIQVKESQKE